MRFLAIFMLAFSLLAARPVAAEELTPQLDDLVRHFGQVLFGSEYGFQEHTPGVISKWNAGTTVGITVQGRQTEKLVHMAAKHVRGLAKLTGLKFKTVAVGTPGPTIDLIFMKRAEMAGLAKQLPPTEAELVRAMTRDPTMVCFFLVWHKPPERIVKSIVAVNVERDPVMIDACLLEELTQVMGLPNDVDAYWPTMFKPVDTSLEWSKWDRLYIKTLYDPRIKPGMKPVDALYVAKDIFAKALAEHAK